MSAEQQIRKSTITKSITRKYNVARFETLDVMIQHEHEIEWDSIATLKSKSNNITTLIREDFEDTANRVLTELQLNGYKAFVTNTQENNKRPMTPEEKKDFDALG